MYSRSLLALFLGAVLAGCATQQSKSLYYWGNYQPSVHAYFRAQSSPDELIVQLEEGAQKAAAEGEALPPGYSAHLGLLYGKAGRHEEMGKAFEAEKTRFPESAMFMDRLLAKFR
ncbi:DUF4810 domain-containing protein [Pseudothauera nasutitermitis]|uniref:DUF4810 domain-containing protein n=1 Tax=Pseudothauera nasutitermitis TaxID=2565930 RepID=A0A4S4AMD7_9RHOO|nr:DUF4810 domain-containing protein [Pseudothauera nasutitermitis]THF60771.1 DUF4810 domain-containing protein [Pseudothauera nasutitermitis]